MKYKAIKPRGSNGWWQVRNGLNQDVCSVYGAPHYMTGTAEEFAKAIADALNAFNPKPTLKHVRKSA